EAPAQPTPTPALTTMVESATPIASADPAKLIEAIKQTQKDIASEMKSIKTQLDAIGSSTEAVQAVDILTRQTSLLQGIDLTLTQQIAALEKTAALRLQYNQVQEGLAKAAEYKVEEPISLIELDQMREELNTETARKEGLETRLKMAQNAYDQAKKALSDAQSKTPAPADAQPAAPDAPQPTPASSPLEVNSKYSTSKLTIWSSGEKLRLQEIELENSQLTKAINLSRIDLLQKSIQLCQDHVVFTHEQFQSQQQLINKEKFDLDRELTRLNTQKDAVNRRLTAVNQKLSETANPDIALREENQARQLEWEGLQTQIEAVARKMDLLEKRLQAWQKRYSIFNIELETVKLQEWKAEASVILEEFDNQESLLNDRLKTRQSDLVTIRTRLEQARADKNDLVTPLELQQKFSQQIMDSIQDQINAFETARRLHQKLINQINERTSALTWSERVDAVLKTDYFDNTLYLWLKSLVIAVCAFFIIAFSRRVFLKRLVKFYDAAERGSYASQIIQSIRNLKIVFLMLVSLYFASAALNIPESVQPMINKIMIIAIILQGGIIVSNLISAWIFRYLARKSKRDASSLSALSIFNFISQVLIWSLALILCIENMGFDASALITGLGIGGIAVALALQNVLGDLFGSLSIVLDKPFVTGDFIIFDNNFLGTVEHIGIKTTRLRSLSGEQIVCSNNDLLKTRIRNFKRMHERRVVFSIGTTYQTTYDQITQIPAIIREAVESQEKNRFDRAHFKAYGDFALLFECVYYVLEPDYIVYMDIQQNINLFIHRKFTEKGIEFAYPTQTIFFQQSALQNPQVETKVTQRIEDDSSGGGSNPAV
ncbi:MAG: mechanosensitive ion channel, partial [Candidatus Omnitrophica bacterium]|nr:mechanosensitive ion channel [Candidatus Omnitrophota bacterium]